MSKAKTDRVTQAIERLLDTFESGKLPAAIARTIIEEQEIDKPSNKWSLGNKLIMRLHGTNDARGYRQWEEVGRHVRKGAKAFYILGPVYKTIKVTEKETDEFGNEVEVEKEKKVLVGFKEIPVFAYEDTEGKELPQPDYKPATMPPLAPVAQKYGVRVAYGPFAGRFYGYYQPATNSIMLCTHDVDVFFHELAHAVHHHTCGPLKGGQDPKQEIVAETVAAVLCELYGFTGYQYHAYRYVSYYAKAKDGQQLVKAIMSVLADVEKVLRAILGEQPKDESEDLAA